MLEFVPFGQIFFFLPRKVLAKQICNKKKLWLGLWKWHCNVEAGIWFHPFHCSWVIVLSSYGTFKQEVQHLYEWFMKRWKVTMWIMMRQPCKQITHFITELRSQNANKNKTGKTFHDVNFDLRVYFRFFCHHLVADTRDVWPLLQRGALAGIWCPCD